MLGGCLLSGCVSDLYAPCNVPDDGSFLSSCLSGQGGADRSCVVEQALQCETRVCGKYQGSAPFCTQPCVADADCEGGVCREFVFQSGAKYCVETSNIR